MLGHIRYIITIAIIAGIILTGCKKEKDEIPPEINIYSPAENTAYDVLDTIFIRASVYDETALKDITVGLVNENRTPVLKNVSIFPHSNSFTFELNYDIDDPYLTGGNYYLWIRAFDGENYKNLYRKLIIYEMPRNLKYVVAISKVNSQIIDINRIYTDMSINKLLTVNNDYAGSGVSSRYQLLFEAGKVYGNLNAYDLDDLSIEWSVNGTNNPPFACFEHLYFTDEQLFVSFTDGYIKGYSSLGIGFYYSQVITDYYPDKIYRHNNLLIAELLKKSGTGRLIGVYYFVSGALKQSNMLPLEVTEFFRKDNDHIFIFGNDGNNGEISVYSIYYNNFTSLHSITGERIISACYIDDNKYLVAGENNIYLYQASVNSLTTFKPGISSIKLVFDDLSGSIFSAESKTMNRYQFPSGSLLQSASLQDTILNLHLVYNK